MEKQEVIEAIHTLRRYSTETNRIEAKSALLGFPKKCYDTFSSFSNKYGGMIIFGIREENNFSTEGVYNIKDLQKQITALCTDAMEPSLRCDILPLEFENKKILAVKIDELNSAMKPCYYKPKGLKKGSYTREGDRDEPMTDYEIYAIQSYNDHIVEDKRPNRSATLEDLNTEQLNSYIQRIKNEKPNFSKNSFEKCLKLSGITDTTDSTILPTLAGTLIFGEYPQAFYPQLFVACTVIPGIDIGEVSELGERFLDNKRVEGTIEEMLEETMNFLRRNMKTRVIINSNGKRINKTEYPLKALREAVANALIHRDYSKQTENAYISVYMYADRIEILNPGALFGTNKLEKLGTATVMEARNPNIVRILEEKGAVIENRHSGIPTMKREMRKYGLPDPEFYEERGSFKVVFRNTSLEEEGGQVEQQMKHNFQQSGQVEQQMEQNFQQTGQVEKQMEQNSQQTGQVEQQMEHNFQQTGQVEQQIEQNFQQSGQVEQQMEQNFQQSEQVEQQNSTKKLQNTVLKYCATPKNIKEISQYLNITSRQYLSTYIINPLIKEKKLVYAIEESIHSRNQKYISNKGINLQNRKNISEYKNMILKFCSSPKSFKEICQHLKIYSRKYISSNIIKPLIKEGKLTYTNPEKIQVKNQKYITVQKD